MEYVCRICNNPIHGETKYRAVSDNKIYEIRLCKKCNIAATVPYPSQDDLINMYSSGTYRTSSGKRFNPAIEYFIYISRLLKKQRIEKYINIGDILDIGCGRGLFLNVMKEHGWRVAGTEFDPETASFISSLYGIQVIPGDLIKAGLPEARFDVITMNHVLEHMQRPAETILECGRLLKKGGLLIAAIPNLSSLQASFGKGGWFHLDPPYHLHHFTEDGLRGLLEKNMFAISKARQFDVEYNIFGWLQTLLNRAGIRKNTLYDFLKKQGIKQKSPAGVSRFHVILSFVLLPVFFPLSVILSLFESCVLHRGGTVEIYAIKQ